MPSQWKQEHERLVRSLKSGTTPEAFAALRVQCPSLAPFPDLEAVLAVLTAPSADVNEKNAIYLDLMREVQQGAKERELAMGLLWVGFWPGLGGACRRRGAGGRESPEEVLSAVVDGFVHAVDAADLSRMQKPALSLLRNARRDAWRRGQPRRDSAGKRLDPDDDEPVDEALAERTARTSALGLPTGLPTEKEIEALREWLRRTLGGDDDADLVIGAVVLEESHAELAARLGITHPAARKRFERVMKRLRRHLEQDPR